MSRIRFGILFAFSAVTAWGDTPLRGPLPIDVALSVRGHDSRSTFAFSPDGRWIAHTVSTNDALPADSRYYSPTGVPLAEGRSRREAHLTDTLTGEEVRLGSATASSWAPTWSSDGSRVAFYSDEGGAAGLWIWDTGKRVATRLPDLTVRPFFGFELPRWANDGRTVLCKVLPQGMTLTQANALSPLPQRQRIFPAHGEGEASVMILRAKAGEAPTPESRTPAFMNRSLADLALLDVQTHAIRRIASNERILWYGFSPDQRYVAYTHLAGEIPNSQDIRYDIELVELRSGQHRRIAQDLPMNYGIELNWSPEGHSLAAIDHDSQGKASLVVIPVDGTPARRLDRAPLGSLDEVAPHWDAGGRYLFVTAGGGHLWRIDALSGAAQELASRAGVEIAALVSKFDQPTAWATNRGSQLWAIAFRRDSQRYSALCIDVPSGRIKSEVQLVGGFETGPNIDATDHGNRISFVASDQRHPEDIWIYNPADHHVRQLSHLNPDLERYELGDTRVITFHTADARTLRASLLLPPAYRQGQRLPTVVWVYGGENGSEAAQTFGLAGRSPVFDMQVLATRGYAVLFPDAPLRPGTLVNDLVATVMSGVDAAIDQGYSDSQRLAVMGHSFGAYSVLSLISHTDRFKAAVVSGANIHPDLVAGYLELDADGSPSWIGYFEDGQGAMGGSPWKYRERYLDNSPVYDFERITTPVLIAQGAEDGRLLGSDATFVALRRLGKDVEYRVYEGEGHVLQGSSSVRDFWQRRLEFLDDRLAGATAH